MKRKEMEGFSSGMSTLVVSILPALLAAILAWLLMALEPRDSPDDFLVEIRSNVPARRMPFSSLEPRGCNGADER